MEYLKISFDRLMIAQDVFESMKEKVYQDIQKDMRKMRTKSGKSYRWTAKVIGCSAVYLCDVENGRRNPTKNLCEWYDRLFFKETL